ncbi:hypothetical protein BGZ58_008208 [Dissophora ornata]|nr:hypothetical protein BGZ58_008208 [Dissophora ornata]
MDPIITSLVSSDDVQDESELSPTFHYKKVNIPLAYPPEAIKEQSSTSKAYVYPPLMSPSDEFFSSHITSSNQPQTSPQPINIPQGQGRRSGGFQSRRNSLPVRATPSVKSGSLPALSSYMPSPPTSPWKRSNSFAKPAQVLIVDETPYPELPTDVRSWASSHVAEYLGYSLRLYPKAITEDLGRYVRQTANLTGAQFIDLKEEDLERMQINLKWRSMIMKAVGMLRRETLRASRIDEMSWEDGYDPQKDGPLPSPSVHSSDEDHSPSHHHSSSATSESEATHVQERSHISNNITTSSSNPNMESIKKETVDTQELRRGIVEDITGVLLSWKKDQEAKAKKAEASSNGGLGFIEGVVIGGLIVAFMMRFSR